MKELHVVFVRNDTEPFGHGGTNSAGMIEVMMGHDDVRERLVRSKLAGLGNDRQRARLVLRCLDQREMVGELDKHAVMRLPGEPPDALPKFLNGDIGRRASGDGRG